MTKDNKPAKELNDADLDQVQGGATAYIGETEKNISRKSKPKSSPGILRDNKSIVAQGGDGSI